MPRNPVSAPARTLLAVLVAASLALPAAAAGEPPGPRPTADAGGAAAREIPPLPGPPPSAVPAEDDPARIAVKPASGVGDKALSAEVARLGGRVGRTLPRIGWTAVEVPPGRAREVAAGLKARGVVSEAAPDRRVHLAHVPDDPLFPEQWSLRNTGQRDGTAGADIGAPEAWDIHTGSSDVVVAVCDTGVDLTHPDLAANAWTNPGEIPGNGIDDDGNGLIDDVNGWDWYNGDETVYDPSDGDSHGTHVAGTIGAVGGNGIGVAGVSHEVSMMALKFIGPHGGSLIDAAEAVLYATDHGARVINHSWASLGAEPYFDDALAYSAARGVLNVAAAGNRAVSLEGVDFFPASSEATNVIAVASSTRYDTLSYFSNWGSTKVHLAAPGSEITSTVPGSYGSKSGTSMAAPHVTGAAALAMAARPGASAAEVRSRLLDTVDRSAWLWGWVASDGRLDAAAALAEEFAAAPSGVVTVTPQAFEAGRVGEVVWGPAPWTAAGTAYEIQAGVRSLALDEGFETGLDG
ncbi:MAG: S8 family serine peptidase, partial [Coriobacteriia bacterium]|nr:S8 family serine peptidase [Coriobacteriia bacterium]